GIVARYFHWCVPWIRSQSSTHSVSHVVADDLRRGAHGHDDAADWCDVENGCLRLSSSADAVVSGPDANDPDSAALAGNRHNHFLCQRRVHATRSQADAGLLVDKPSWLLPARDFRSSDVHRKPGGF